MELNQLKKLVKQGEHQQLEFKQSLPAAEKLVREAIALANADGGMLLIGVDDNGEIVGLKDPEEAVYFFKKSLKRHCRPALKNSISIIPVSRKRSVVAVGIPESEKKPHYYVKEPRHRRGRAFFRLGDRSIAASRELFAILRNKRQKRDIIFEYGEAEKQLLEYLEDHGTITIPDFMRIAGISKKKASQIMVLLVSAGVLAIHPSEEEDEYTLENIGQ